MHLKAAPILAPLLFAIHLCLAQGGDLFFNHLTIQDGLSQTSNHFIYKDSRGFVWISSQDGLNRYDGKNVKVYKNEPGDRNSLSGNNIQSQFFEDETGNIWFATYNAVSCYVRERDEFRNYTLEDDTGKKVLGYHVAYKDQQGQLGVVANGNELYRFNPADTSWTYLHDFPVPIHRVAPFFDEAGKLAYLTAYTFDIPGIHLFSYRSDGSHAYTSLFDGTDGEPPIYPLVFLPEADSILWVGTTGGLGRYRVGPDQHNMQLYPSFGSVHSVNFLDHNHLILGTNKGVKVVDKSLSQLVRAHYRHEPDNPFSLAGDAARSVYVDPDGVIWIYVQGEGVDFASPEKVKFRTTELHPLSGRSTAPVGVFAMAEDKTGKIWCSTRMDGVYVLSPDLQPIDHFSANHPQGKTVPGNDVRYLFLDDENRCWAYTFNGLGLRKPGATGFQRLNDGKIFLYGLQLKNGSILSASLTGGLYRAEEKGGEGSMVKLPQVDDSAPFTILFENREGLLYACRGLSSIWIMDPEDNFRVEESLPVSGEINSFCEQPDGDTLWIATSKGLVRFDQRSREIRYFNESDGLPNNFVYSVVPGKPGELWLTTNRGISRFSTRDSAFHNFDILDGIQSLEFNSFSSLTRKNGEILFGGQQGLNAFHPDRISLLQQVPQVQITRLLVNDEPAESLSCKKTGATNISEIEKLVFDYTSNTLSFDFAALEYSNPSRNRFLYMLDKYDRDWVDGETRGFARYANLRPGTYTFMVKGANSDGVWSEPKELEIVILSPVWMRWWFLTLVFLTLLAVGYRIYSWRINQLLRVERVRNQISSDLHDDIGATLSNVNILVTLVKQRLPENSEVLPLLARIEEEVQSSAGSLDDIIWSVNPQNDPLDRILARMRRFAGEVFEAKDIEGELHFPPGAKYIRLNMEKRRQFYLVFKEAVNNLAKYSGCKKAVISVTCENGNLHLSVSDDGKGFDPVNVPEGSNGLKTMQQRTRNLHGDLAIETAPGKGTNVTLSFPVTEKGDGKKKWIF